MSTFSSPTTRICRKSLKNDADTDSLTDPKDAGKSIVTVNIPPASGPFTGKAGYAEVIITYYQQRGFSTIFGSNNLPVKARAVARGSTGNIGILILDPVISDSAEIDGNVNILILLCRLWIDVTCWLPRTPGDRCAEAFSTPEVARKLVLGLDACFPPRMRKS